jgi:D-alanine-D-alanine ligase
MGLKIAVLRGGRSAEREVSLRSGAQVEEALRRRGHDVTGVDLDPMTWDTLRDGRFGCVFNALHGRLGEDGTVQGMLELLAIPYTGSGVLASALCMDKARANAVMAGAGLHVPEFQELEIKHGVSADVVESLGARFGLPLVVKPVREGSTIGLTIAADADQVASGLVLAARYDRRVLVQRFATGTEITVGILATPDLQVLPTLEIVSDNPVYDYDAKYTAGKSHHIIPARIPDAARTAASEAAGRAFTALGCSGMGRVDIIVDAAGTPWLLEVNTVPGLTALSLLPDAARAAGITFDELCQRLVDHAIGRHDHHVGPPPDAPSPHRGEGRGEGQGPGPR